MSILNKVALLFLLIILILAIPSFAATSGTITDQSVRLRKGPSLEEDILLLMELKAKVEVIEKSGDWYKVKYKETTGYVSKDYIKVEQVTTPYETEENDNEIQKPEQDTPTVESNSKTNENTQEEINDKKTSEQLNVYIIPHINSSSVGKIEKDVTVTISNKINRWAYVTTDKLSGWILYDKLIDVDKAAEVNSNNVSEYKEQNNSNSSEEVTISKKGYIKVDSARVRKEPSIDSEVISGLIYNQEISIVAKNGEWYKLEINGGYGYIAEWLVSDTKLETTNRSLDTNRSQSASNTGSVSETNKIADQLIEYAKKYLGCKYVYGGKGPNVFDCAGFTQYVYKKFGYSLAGGATSQSRTSGAIKVERGNLQKGDLVFFLDYQTMVGIGHVGIYIGDGNFIHASSGSPAQVKISTLLTGAYKTRYHSAIRILK